MNGQVFINIALDAALKKYLLFKEKNDYSLTSDFLVYTIGILSYIYGEADIINPFKTNTDSNIFNHNLMKFGLEEEKLYKFLNDLNNFYNLDVQNKTLNYQNKNPFFVYVQEDLIDMFICKYNSVNMGQVELDNFGSLLYSPKNNSEFRRNYNKIMCEDENEVLNYYQSKIYQNNNHLTFELIKSNVLNQKIYDSFGLESNDIAALSQNDLNNINNQIFNYFKINPIEPNLEQKILNELAQIKPGTLKFSLANNSKLVNTILILLSFGAFILSGILIGLKMMGK